MTQRASHVASRRVTLRLTPPQVPIARRTTLTAAVSSGGRPVTVGTVVFTVNGSPAGQAVIDAGGVATSTWSTYLAGAHEVRARYLGAGPYAASVSDAATLTVR